MRTVSVLAALALVAGSSAAVAQTAQPLSLSHSPAARAGAPVSGAGELNTSGPGIYILGAIALGLIIWGIIELTSGDDGPDSP
jgi:hypothetical protein